jgi:H+/Cl- antiporter ClcA
VLGVPAAFAATIFMSLIHGITLLMWTTIPEAFAWKSPAAWYVLAVPTVAGLLVAGTLRLPGHGGESAVKGPAFDPLPPLQLVSALLAALITLGFGLVLGPESPLIALGTAMGLLTAGFLRPPTSGRQMLVLAGAFATISTLFGGPLVSALMLLELLAFSGRVPAKSLIPAIIPGFVASGTAALIFTGIDNWPGVHHNVLALPPLPNYPHVRIADIVWCVLVALVVAVVVAVARAASLQGAVRAVTIPPVALLCGAGFSVGLLAVIFRAITSQPVNLVLFSGETTMAPVIAETSAGVLVLLVLCKGVGYILSLGAGFRGGPTFPAVALGVGLGVLASIVLPGLDLTPAVIAGVAAGASAALDLGIFGALLAAFLAGAAITAETIPIAVIASVIGWLVATAVKARAGAGEQTSARPAMRPGRQAPAPPASGP